jgi:hypothetical protein
VVRGAGWPPLPHGGYEMVLYISLRLFRKKRVLLILF